MYDKPKEAVFMNKFEFRFGRREMTQAQRLKYISLHQI